MGFHDRDFRKNSLKKGFENERKNDFCHPFLSYFEPLFRLYHETPLIAFPFSDWSKETADICADSCLTNQSRMQLVHYSTSNQHVCISVYTSLLHADIAASSILHQRTDNYATWQPPQVLFQPLRWQPGRRPISRPQAQRPRTPPTPHWQALPAHPTVSSTVFPTWANLTNNQTRWVRNGTSSPKSTTTTSILPRVPHAVK